MQCCQYMRGACVTYELLPRRKVQFELEAREACRTMRGREQCLGTCRLRRNLEKSVIRSKRTKQHQKPSIGEEKLDDNGKTYPEMLDMLGDLGSL